MKFLLHFLLGGTKYNARRKCSVEFQILLRPSGSSHSCPDIARLFEMPRVRVDRTEFLASLTQEKKYRFVELK